MRRPALLLIALLPALAAAPARAQFAGTADLSGELAAIGAQAQAQKALAESLPPLGVEAAPDVGPYAVRGVDVSHYQGAVDWSLVAGAGLSFAYIKATQGASGLDARFAANWSGAAAAGLRRGAYHFFDACRDGASQAANFLKTAPPEDAALPAAVDLEPSPSCPNLPSKKLLLQRLDAFLSRVRAAYGGREPVLYVNVGLYDRYFRGEPGYRVWISATSRTKPVLSDGRPWTFWQYAVNGRVPGIPRAVDLDVFYSSPEILASLGDRAPVAVMLADASTP
ncbi:MAG: glycosyl hydrolase [Elusimicrobia bacterium]|nr:glycosyl hydrolase [Elusimicrobiota bacterium]